MTGARAGLSLETREEPKAAGGGEKVIVQVQTPYHCFLLRVRGRVG